jgi:hypothetical protein
LEDALSVFEGDAVTAMVAVDDISSTLSPGLKRAISRSDAGSGCRLPVIRRGHERMKELAAAFASIMKYKDEHDFI